MKCSRCRRAFRAQEAKCPHCGLPNPSASGTFQTSTVLISSAGSERVYRSVEEVPPRLRTQLLKSTNGANSATILIADRRGRKEIARAMRKLPGGRHRRLAGSGPGGETQRAAWLTPRRRILALAAITMLLAALIAIIFLHRWS